MKYQDPNAAVGSTAILGAIGVSGLDGRFVTPAWVKHRSSTSWCLKSK